MCRVDADPRRSRCRGRRWTPTPTRRRCYPAASGSRQDDCPADPVRGGLSARQAALQTGDQRVARLAGVDQLVEAQVLGGAVGRLQFGVAQLGAEVVFGVRRLVSAAALIAPIVAPG